MHLKGIVDHDGVLSVETRGEMTKQGCPYIEGMDCRDSCALFEKPIKSGPNHHPIVSIKLCKTTLTFDDFQEQGVKIVSREREALEILVMNWANRNQNHLPNVAYDELHKICWK